MDDKKITFSGEKLRKLRVMAGLDQKELAKRSGCRNTDIWRYEKNQFTPKPERIASLAKALNVDTLELFEGAEHHQAQAHPFTPEENIIIEKLLSLDKFRMARVLGYVEGLLASKNHSSARQGADLSSGYEAGHEAPKPPRKPSSNS